MCVALERAGQVEDPLETLKVTRAGFEPSEVIEVAVKPTGLPVLSLAVITATPEAWRLNAALRASLASWLVFGSDITF